MGNYVPKVLSQKIIEHKYFCLKVKITPKCRLSWGTFWALIEISQNLIKYFTELDKLLDDIFKLRQYLKKISFFWKILAGKEKKVGNLIQNWCWNKEACDYFYFQWFIFYFGLRLLNISYLILNLSMCVLIYV